MSTIAAVAGALVALVSLITWFLKRKNEATPEQRKDDRAQELLNLAAEIRAARASGNDARAESLLRRLRALSEPEMDRAGGKSGATG